MNKEFINSRNKYTNEPLFKLTNFGLTPNIVKGGYQNPVGDGIFQMHATKKGTDNIFVGKDLAVDDKELVRANGNYVEVLSHDLKLPNGNSPVEVYQDLVNGGFSPSLAFNNAFKIQEDYKTNNKNKTTARFEKNKHNLGGKTHMDKYTDRIGNSQLFTINPIPTGGQTHITFKNGGRIKADLGKSALWTNLGTGLLNTLAQVFTGGLTTRNIKNMYENMTRNSTYVPVEREHIVYNDASESKRAAVRESAANNERYIDVNTNSSKVANNRRMINNLDKAKGLIDIENHEIERRDNARNEEARLQSQFDIIDNQNRIADTREANDFNMQKAIGIANARTQGAQIIGEGIASGLHDIGQSVSDYAKYNNDLLTSETDRIQNIGIKNNMINGYMYDSNGNLKRMYRNRYYDDKGNIKTKYSNKKNVPSLTI